VFELLDRAYLTRMRRERGFGVNPWRTHSRFLVSHPPNRPDLYGSAAIHSVGMCASRGLPQSWDSPHRSVVDFVGSGCLFPFVFACDQEQEVIENCSRIQKGTIRRNCFFSILSLVRLPIPPLSQL
jgi:hypothetical protein